MSNGLSLCTIHHRAFDHDLVGVTPDYEVRVARRLLDDEDGPMLELLKQFHRQPIVLPNRYSWRPARERLRPDSNASRLRVALTGWLVLRTANAAACPAAHLRTTEHLLSTSADPMLALYGYLPM